MFPVLLTDLTDGAVVGRLVPGPRPQHRFLAGCHQGFLHPLTLLQRPQQAVPVTGTEASATGGKERKIEAAEVPATYLIISNSLWSETLMLRAMFQERCTMGTMDLTLWSLFHSYRSTASLYWWAERAV